jgi:hypothetical protein
MSGGAGRALCGALVGALLCSAACAGGRGRPDWIDGSAASYPRERYLVGVGEAENLDAARDRARAEIARIFEVRIEDSIVDRSEAMALVEEARRASSVVEHIAVETRTSTEAALEGVDIAETWSDRESRRVYALAVLDKQWARRRLLEQARQRTEEMSAFREAAETAHGALARVRALLGAARASRERDRLLAHAAVVGSVAPTALDAADALPMQTEVFELLVFLELARVDFSVRARGKGSSGDTDLPGLRGALSARLARMGLRAADPAAAWAALQVDCRLELLRIERGGAGWRHYRWEGACEVADASGAVLSVADIGSESHPVGATALAKAKARAEQVLAEAVERELQRYLYGEE